MPHAQNDSKARRNPELSALIPRRQHYTVTRFKDRNEINRSGNQAFISGSHFLQRGKVDANKLRYAHYTFIRHVDFPILSVLALAETVPVESRDEKTRVR